ncbi:MAG: aldehyde dehydrogenase family protein [Acidobacteria bacterium]|nr:aldehyde dehydrogenase family protein [Acidobacteriota bacterium]
MNDTRYSRRFMSVRKVQLAFDGVVVAEVPETPLAELPAILKSAGKASLEMAEMSRDQRASILFRASAKFTEQRNELARTITLESGKPIREARAEVDRAAATLFCSGEEAHRLAGEEIPMDASAAGRGRVAQTMRQPLGIIAAITPFNFPLNLAMHKVGPSIAAGNATLLKPASATPLSAMHAASILISCGLPADALQVLIGSGSELGQALVEAPPIRMISFTGSAEIGMGISARAGMKKISLELGNNSAVIVLDDVDLDAAAAACVPGAYSNSGQTCISVQRIYVASGVHAAFTERFVDLTRKLKIAHPLEEDCDVSCLISEQEAIRVQSWIGEAVREGATLLSGGGRNLATLQPTVMAQVPLTSKLHKDEVFGPVVGINAVSNLDEAIALVNDSRFGLQAGVFTYDLRSAWRCARNIKAGGVMINDVSNFRVDQMPYGGTKESGLGKEGPRYAVEQMTELKLVSWRLA